MVFEQRDEQRDEQREPSFTLSFGDSSLGAGEDDAAGAGAGAAGAGAAGTGTSGSGADGVASSTRRSFVRRRRNRHGRGLRGPILPAGLPASRTRGEKFEDLVVDSAERLRELWSSALEQVDYLVEEVPDNLEALIAAGSQVPLGKYRAATAGTISSGVSTAQGTNAEQGTKAERAVVIVYRHPIETLCEAPWETRELIHEVLIEQVAGLLNIDPDTVDPLFRRFRGH